MNETQIFLEKIEELPIEEVQENFYQLFQEALTIEESEKQANDS